MMFAQQSSPANGSPPRHDHRGDSRRRLGTSRRHSLSAAVITFLVLALLSSPGAVHSQPIGPGGPGGPAEPGPATAPTEKAEEQQKVMPTEDQGDRRFFVTPMAMMSGDGSRFNPFASIEDARDHIRKLRAAGEIDGAVYVWLFGGLYMLEDTIVFNEVDAGTREQPTIFEPVPGNPVRILGGPLIPRESLIPVQDPAIRERLDPEVRDKVLEVDLKGMFGMQDFGEITPRGPGRPYQTAPVELFSDAKAMTLARWPNEGQELVPVGEVLDPGSDPRKGELPEIGGTFRYSADRPERWRDGDDIWLAGCFNRGYGWDVVKVDTIDRTARTIATAHATLDQYQSGKPWHGWYAFNILEELDAPGEYYIDRKAGKAYLIPPDGAPDATISISKMDKPLLSFQNTSYVMFRGVTLEATRAAGVTVEGGRNTILLGCAIRNVGSVGVAIGQGISPLERLAPSGTGQPISGALGSWHEHLMANPEWNRNAGRFHEVRDCDIYNTGAGGVSLGGGDRKTRGLGCNIVKNTRIYNFNRWERTWRAGVNIDGAGNIVAYCSIHDCPGSAIYLHGSDQIIEHTLFRNAANRVDDYGVVYMGGDPSEYNNTLRYNYFNDCESEVSTNTATIYMDDGACGTQILANTFRNLPGKLGAVYIDGGGLNLIENNVFIDCDVTLRYDDRTSETWTAFLESDEIKARLQERVDIKTDIYKSRFPELAEIYETAKDGVPLNTFNRNVLSGSGPLLGGPVKSKDIYFSWDGLDLVSPADITQGFPENSIITKVPRWEDMRQAQTGLIRTPARVYLPGEEPPGGITSLPGSPPGPSSPLGPGGSSMPQPGLPGGPAAAAAPLP